MKARQRYPVTKDEQIETATKNFAKTLASLEVQDTIRKAIDALEFDEDVNINYSLGDTTINNVVFVYPETEWEVNRAALNHTMRTFREAFGIKRFVKEFSTYGGDTYYQGKGKLGEHDLTIIVPYVPLPVNCVLKKVTKTVEAYEMHCEGENGKS
jgi:hypothetical protein